MALVALLMTAASCEPDVISENGPDVTASATDAEGKIDDGPTKVEVDGITTACPKGDFPPVPGCGCKTPAATSCDEGVTFYACEFIGPSKLRWTVKDRCEDKGEICDNTFGCACVLGATRCVKGKLQECENKVPHNNWTDGEECPPGKKCEPGKGCVVPPEDCKKEDLDTLRCIDGVSVSRCEADKEGYLNYKEVFNCADHGFENCGPGAKGEPEPSKPVDLCVNICGGYGKTFKATVGDKVTEPGLSCAKYVCEGTNLVPDHDKCKALGHNCTYHKECASLKCGPNGQCAG